MKKLFVANLPTEATEASVLAMFSEFGQVRSLKVASDIFTRTCKGFAFIEMEGHEARAAIAGLDGRIIGNNEKPLRIGFEDTHNTRGRRRR
ncbi:MAG: RNA recognition motif domain-containing protein [Candidatus Promineifilaceae bacterium]|jgi:RNA recognition motif-containing protein